jgi:hypothetical protein
LFQHKTPDTDRDGALAPAEFAPLYKLLAAARRAFKRRDAHWNGLIDRYDFLLLMQDLGVFGGGDASSGVGGAGDGITRHKQQLVAAAAQQGPGQQQPQQPKQPNLQELVENAFR